MWLLQLGITSSYRKYKYKDKYKLESSNFYNRLFFIGPSCTSLCGRDNLHFHYVLKNKVNTFEILRYCILKFTFTPFNVIVHSGEPNVVRVS